MTSPKPHSQPYRGWGAKGADFPLQVRKLCFLLSDILSAHCQLSGWHVLICFVFPFMCVVGWFVCLLFALEVPMDQLLGARRCLFFFATLRGL